ncbi:MAG: tetratricopeptide repeat protein [Gemmatimonas sp.]
MARTARHGAAGTRTRTAIIVNHAPTDDVRRHLEAGVAEHQAGRLDAARVNYERALALDGDNVQALDLLGVVHAFQGRSDDAAAVLRRAVELAPDFAPALNHLGLVLKSRGQTDDAAACFRRAIAAAPDAPDAHVNLGNALLEKGNPLDALACFREALRLSPNAAAAHNNIGSILFAQGAVEEALESFRRAIAAAPNFAAAHANVGRALNALGRNATEAAAAFRRALGIDPRFTNAHTWLGETLIAAGQHGEAAASFREALALKPDSAEIEYKLGLALAHSSEAAMRAEAEGHFARTAVLARRAVESAPTDPDAWHLLGNALIRLGRPDEGFPARLRAAQIVRDPQSRDYDHLPSFRRTSREKLDHDIEQIEYLRERSAIAEPLGADLLTSYRTVRDRLPPPAPGARLVELSADDRRLIGATYKKLWHVAPAPEVAGGAVDPHLDSAAIEADYFGRGPGITTVDGLLTPEALVSLRRFCLESTIWFTDTYPNGYIGSLGDDGFVCPLLLQIGRELPRALPNIFRGHPLLMMWAYKYGQRPEGISIHADYAAINVNFWITPDDANLDPASGGLVVWDREAPADWGFRIHELDQKALREFVDDARATAHRVTYRQNRAVIFNSDLVHQTDEIRFRPGYENRRINVTFLYGVR